MKRVVGITGTVVVHAAVVLFLLWVPPKNKVKVVGASEPVPLISVRLIPKANSPITPVPTAGNEDGIKGKTAEERICSDKDENYEGIGIIYSPISSVVLTAPESYPAYRAGMRVDDILLDTRQEPDSAGYVTYRILRGKDQLTLRIKTEKICFEHNKGPSDDGS